MSASAVAERVGGLDLARLLRPGSVAVVGATERPGAYGSEALLNLRRLGYPGRVYAVNPGRAAVHGVACFERLAALPEAPDAVVVAVPAAASPEVVAEAGALGCGGAVVFAAGFAESPGGAAFEAELAAAATRHRLPVCGPNGNGVVSRPARAALWGDMVAPAVAGAVALVSASGNVAVNALGSRRGLRLHTVVSCGNEAVVTAPAWVAGLAEQQGVRSVAVYVEDGSDGVAWSAALEACAWAGVGVAVLKAGASPAGAAAAAAHTGAVAGDARVFRALCEEAGAAWARDPHDLLELAKALAADRAPSRRASASPSHEGSTGRSLGQAPAPAGRASSSPSHEGSTGRSAGRAPAAVGRASTSPFDDGSTGRSAGGVAVMACSGGDAALAADVAAATGVALPALAPATVERLRRVLPEAVRPANPLDSTSLLWEDAAALGAIVRALAADPAVDRVLAFHDHPVGMDAETAASFTRQLDALCAGADGADAPFMVASTLPEGLDDEHAAELCARGIPAVAGLTTAVHAAHALTLPPADPVRLAAIHAECRSIRAMTGFFDSRRAVGGWVAEHAAKALVARGGLAVPRGETARTPEEAAAVAKRVGYPVAVKLSSPRLQHKTQAGAIRLNCRSEQGVDEAARHLISLPHWAVPEEHAATLLVERMAEPGTDLLIAVRRDGAVPVLVVGAGGIDAERLDDVQLVPLPVDEQRVAAAIRALRVTVEDVEAAARAASAAARVATAERLDLLELNPVRITDGTATVLDAVAHRQEEPTP